MRFLHLLKFPPFNGVSFHPANARINKIFTEHTVDIPVNRFATLE